MESTVSNYLVVVGRRQGVENGWESIRVKFYCHRRQFHHQTEAEAFNAIECWRVNVSIPSTTAPMT